MNSNEKYMARLLFGNVEGLKFNLKNLKYATTHKGFSIVDSRIYGFKFITIVNANIECSMWNYKKEQWEDSTYSVQEFWDITKSHKSKLCIIKNK